MKVALLVLLAGVALCQVNLAQGFVVGAGLVAPGLVAPWRFGLGPWGLGAPWGIGPWGGLGWVGPWGGLGWGGLGWGRFGFGGLGFGRFGFGRFGGFAGRGFFRGKREAGVTTGNKTLCSFSTKKNMISCHGARHNFECEAIPQFVELKSMSYRIHNLTVVPTKVNVENVEHQVYNLFSRKPEENVLNKYTLIEKPDRKVTFSVYRSDKVRENGLRIQDETCWTSFVRMIKESKPEHVRFALFITNTTPVTKTAALQSNEQDQDQEQDQQEQEQEQEQQQQ